MDFQQWSVLNPNYFHGCHPKHPQNHLESVSSGPKTADSSFDSPHSSQNSLIRWPERRRVLERLMQKYGRVEFPGKALYEAYLHQLYRRGCRINTLRLTVTSLTQFLTFYQQAGKSALEQLSRDELEAFVEFKQDQGVKPNTIRTRLCAVYAFIRFLTQQKIVGYELLESRIRLKQPDRLPRAIDPDDLSQLLAAVDRPRDRAMVLLLLRTGMRIGELLNTRVADIDLREKKILIYQAEKTAVGRVVYYSDDAHRALLSWLKRRAPLEEYLFYGRNGNRLSYETARSAFCSCLQAARLAHSGYSLHCLRHTFATDLLNAGMRLECLQVLLGHRSLEITRRYARLSDKTREEEYFTAMRRIETGACHVHDQRDY